MTLKISSLACSLLFHMLFLQSCLFHLPYFFSQFLLYCFSMPNIAIFFSVDQPLPVDYLQLHAISKRLYTNFLFRETCKYILLRSWIVSFHEFTKYIKLLKSSQFEHKMFIDRYLSVHSFLNLFERLLN